MRHDQSVACALGFLLATLFWALVFILPILEDMEHLEQQLAEGQVR